MNQTRDYIKCPHCGFKHEYPEEYAKDYDEHFQCDNCDLLFGHQKLENGYWVSWRR